MKIPQLKGGESIAIAAPASSFSKADFLAGVQFIASMGYKPLYRDDIFSAFGPGLAGPDERRRDELQDYLDDPTLAAILFARGGWGSQRIVSRLNWTAFERTPKILLGASDLTTLHLASYRALSVPFFYGPVVAKGLSKPLSPLAEASFRQALTGTFVEQAVILNDAQAIKAGSAEGPICGGCLTLLVTASGTPYGFSFSEKILFIEDINEKPYAIDRMLTHLRESGRLKGLRGLLCGRFVNCGTEADLKAIVLDHFGDLDIPILWNAPYGHGEHALTLPLGIPCRMETEPASLTYLS